MAIYDRWPIIGHTFRQSEELEDNNIMIMILW